jgi:hypothetical protein
MGFNSGLKRLTAHCLCGWQMVGQRWTGGQETVIMRYECKVTDRETATLRKVCLTAHCLCRWQMVGQRWTGGRETVIVGILVRSDRQGNRSTEEVLFNSALFCVDGRWRDDDELVERRRSPPRAVANRKSSPLRTACVTAKAFVWVADGSKVMTMMNWYAGDSYSLSCPTARFEVTDTGIFTSRDSK